MIKFVKGKPNYEINNHQNETININILNISNKIES
jgi:hypothetical protein